MKRLYALALSTFFLGGAAATEPEEEFLDSSACSAVFGSDKARATNEADRRQSLYEFASTEKGWDIVHTVPKWRRPVPLRLEAVVVDGLAEVDGEDALVVHLRGPLAAACPEGPYLVHIDDALGQRARVLGTSDEGALVEMDGQLHAMTFDGERVPDRVRMVWRSAYDISVAAAPAKKATSAKAKAKRKKAKRKKKKKKSKKR